jgi:exonuclease SbcC
MRLHDLSITAFGPFVETVHVDFDELAAGGLFLLTGDTGAGKTSVLDAVCFALYGEVPGDRHSARHLRSDHAAAHDEPRVVLRLSIGDRTFRFTRSPAWERPKRRGTGTTRVQAHVVVEERRDGGWTALTNRLDEAGQLVTGLLGMTCTQFTQVAMLPQGRFQAFLRASSSDRHAVLQRLFRTRRFEEVERWLADRRVGLRRRSQTCHDRCAGVVNRLQEAAGVGVPDGWDLHDLDDVVDDDSLLDWAVGLSRQCGVDESAAAQALAAATSRLERDRLACEHGRSVAEARLRGERARRTLDELDQTSEVETTLVETVEAHRRAVSVLPASLRLEQATEAVEAAEAAWSAHASKAAALVGVAPHEVCAADVGAAAASAGEARAVAESWLPREVELHDERARLTSLVAQRSRLEDQVSTAEQEGVRLAGSREQLRPRLAESHAVAAGLAEARQAVTDAEAGLTGAQQAAVLGGRLEETRALLRAATGRAQDLRERYLDLRERRISGMAAELASGLAAGCSCPVCGSAEHPSPAVASAGVSRAEEDAAREEHETADFERQAFAESEAALEAQLLAARSRSDERDPEHWREQLAEAEVRLERCVLATRSVEALEAEMTDLDRRDQELATTLAGAAARLEALVQQHTESDERCQRLAAQLRELLVGHPEATSVSGLVARLGETERVLDEAGAALAARERAVHELTQAEAAADAAAGSAGFASLRQAMQAVLSMSQAAARSSELESRRAVRASAAGVLDDQEVAAALAEQAPDLDALSSAARAAEQGRDRASAAHQQARTRVQRVQALTDELARELEAWEPVRREHGLVAGLASLVDGRSADNQLKMRLSAYVLSERLRQVVAAANERLGAMTDERYTLEQADEKGAGEQRGGLSLRVRDEWSGKQRDPATLSGGETFLVSLALALGLADTVSHEAGGTQLETLFIDEGFGALDAGTLDGVMDTLDSLRDGGRVVGLVSHVAELRNRVPSQLEVRKARHGSTLCASVTTG